MVEDKNIVLGKVSNPTNTTADGGGITLLGATDNDKTIIYNNTGENWSFSENINMESGKVLKSNNVEILSAHALGSAVTGSSSVSYTHLTLPTKA